MLTTAQQIDILFEGCLYDADLDCDIHEFATDIDPFRVEQERETTTYTFHDGSKLIVGTNGYEVA